MYPRADTSIVDAVVDGDLTSVLEEIGEAVAFVDATWTVRFCNNVYLRGVGLPRSEVIGRTPFDYFPSFKRSIFYETAESCLRKGVPMARIGYSTAIDRWVLARVFPVRGGMLLMANDASESIVKQQQLAQKVLLDPLTALGNKLAMEQVVGELAATGQPFAVIVIGMERFRQVNDSHGFAFGDMVLLELASALQSGSAPGETVFRLSGDEFAVVRQSDDGDTAARASAFVAAVSKPIVRSGTRVVLNACAGTVESPRDGAEHELLLQRASLALRDAKRQGRDTVAAYRTELELAARLRDEIEAELRVALEGNQFTLHLQPKVSLANGAVIGGEALIRWAHPRRGLLAPGAFLGVAEEIGMMVALDQWVLRAALRHCAQLRAAGLNLPLSINLSVDSLSDIYLVQRVRDALAESGVPSALLEVEVPEGALMRDVQTSARVLTELADMGVRVSVDDFGTGYSSFAYLAQFPVHSLKIDRSFVKDLASSDNNRKIAKAMVRMAHSLSLDVVAEGAETEEQVELLTRMKCDAVQGYFFARPMPYQGFQAFAAGRPMPATPMATAI